jgi:hypothetical protein
MYKILKYISNDLTIQAFKIWHKDWSEILLGWVVNWKSFRMLWLDSAHFIEKSVQCKGRSFCHKRNGSGIVALMKMELSIASPTSMWLQHGTRSLQQQAPWTTWPFSWEKNSRSTQWWKLKWWCTWRRTSNCGWFGACYNCKEMITAHRKFPTFWPDSLHFLRILLELPKFLIGYNETRNKSRLHKSPTWFSDLGCLSSPSPETKCITHHTSVYHVYSSISTTWMLVLQQLM